MAMFRSSPPADQGADPATSSGVSVMVCDVLLGIEKCREDGLSVDGPPVDRPPRAVATPFRIATSYRGRRGPRGVAATGLQRSTRAWESRDGGRSCRGAAPCRLRALA